MGQGLGANSPVVLTLGKENYDALISRHGQWVRWRIATKCPCVKQGTQQPDIHCEKCAGLGVTYGIQKIKEVSQTVMIVSPDKYLDLGEEYYHCELVSVHDSKGKVYNNVQKIGQYLHFDSALPEKGIYITAVMTEQIIHEIKKETARHIGCGYYQVPGLKVHKNNIEGLYHSVASDIQSIKKVEDAQGSVLRADELRQDTFYVEPLEDAEYPATLLVHGIKYIPPFTFVVLNQDLTETDNKMMQDASGDAIMSFPYTFDVSNEDVITILSGTYTQKSIIARRKAKYDVISDYFVDSIISCVGIDREYKLGEDFILVGTNYIKWLCDDDPDIGEAYSLTYRVNPTYKVVRSIPQIRTSENQCMPKKAIIKLLSSYSEKVGLNRQ